MQQRSIFLKILAIVTIAEFLVMVLLKIVHVPAGIVESVTDALLLSLFSAPFLYFFVILPVARNLAEKADLVRKTGEQEKALTGFAARLKDSETEEEKARILAERTQFLNRINTLALQESDIDSMLSGIAREVCGFLGSQRCILRIYSDPEMMIEHHAPGLTEAVSSSFFSRSSSLFQPVFETGRNVVLNDTRGISRHADWEEELERIRLGSCIGVPLRVQEALDGILVFGREEAHEWTPEEVITAEAVARQTTVAFRHNQVFRRYRELAEQMVAVMNNVPGVIYRGHKDWSVSLMGTRVEQVAGYTAEEFINGVIRWKELIQPSDLDSVRRTFREAVLEKKKVLRIEYRALHKDGSYRWIMDRRQFVYDEQGVFLHVDGIILDITDRKLAEEALDAALKKAEEERAKTEAIIAAIGEGISIQDRQFQVIYQNEVRRKLVGDQLGRFCYEVYGNKDSLCEGCPTAEAYRDGGVHTAERRAENEKGVMYVEVTASPLWDSSGNIVAGVEVVRDITERVRSGEALQESETRYRGLFEHMQEGFAYCRMIFENGEPVDFSYISVNAAFETLTGLMGAAGKRVTEVIPGIRESDPALFEIYGRVARTGNPEKIEIFVEALQQWFLISVYSPEQGYFVAVFDVITGRKRAEVEKEKLHAELQQAMKMEAVGRLAGGVAHDFNNLLTVIIGNISMARAKLSKDDPVTGVLMEANKAADRAAALTQQLLAFSRKQIIEPKVLNLNDLIADLHAMLLRLIREDIEIQTLQGNDLGSVKIDAGQFQQVLVNLVVNARDAMPDGGKIVIETSSAELGDGYCSTHSYVKPGKFVMVAVSDTGHGMSEETKAHLFEPFFTTKAKGSGTGLGLATTYGAVKQAGGSIEVYSEVGMGTTFKIYLPRDEGEASKLVGDDKPQRLLGGSETILLVEDEDIVRDMCVKILDDLGYRVLQAANGEEAVALSKEHGGWIDLLMTDVVMPGMNGSELATQLILHHPETRVLFTSGYTENVIVHHGVLEDGVSFLGKPYSPSVLAMKIREVLDPA